MMIEHFSGRRGAIGWFARRGQAQRRGDLVSVTKIAAGQAEREAEIAARYRPNYRRGQ